MSKYRNIIVIKLVAFILITIFYQSMVYADKKTVQYLAPATIFEKTSRAVVTESELFDENLLAKRREYLKLAEQACAYANRKWEDVHYTKYRKFIAKTKKGILNEYTKADALYMLKKAGIVGGV